MTENQNELILFYNNDNFPSINFGDLINSKYSNLYRTFSFCISIKLKYNLGKDSIFKNFFNDNLTPKQLLI